tara:strand:- start:1140 stop:1949 length:810 start_codon:yes stop_codon:yes gene_type:complete
MNPRGMPDVSISQSTQDRMDEEAQQSTKKANSEMFENPNVKLEIKPTEEIPMDRNGNMPPEVSELPEGFAKPAVEPKEKPVKKKKQLTQKQLDGLAKGRETSMRNRQAKAKAGKEAKAEASNRPPPSKPVEVPKQVHYQEPEPMGNPLDRHGNYQGQSNTNQYQQPQIDYDKIINGVANIYQQREQQKSQFQQEQEQANSDVAMFEEHIRTDERMKLMKKFEDQEKENVKAKALKTTQGVYNRQPNSGNEANPYAYAFNLNSRNNFKRY